RKPDFSHRENTPVLTNNSRTKIFKCDSVNKYQQ
ncbi:MAG: hypothetical protein ACI9T9_002422, partial [Oleiphilaceae bacterium]